MGKKFISKKASRRALTATMSLVFMISLSSCSGAVNTDGNIDSSKVYASAGDYKITYGELWNELQWSSSSVVEQQIETVVLDKYINKLEILLSNTYAEYSTLSEKEQILNIESEEEYNKLKSKYEDRLVDYVVKDIYDFNFSSRDYWDRVETLDDNIAAYTEAMYIDDTYSSYQIETINDKTIAELIENNNSENRENYLAIGNAIPQLYYAQLAAELLAYDKLNEKIAEADENDDDDDDDQLGYFSNTDYVSIFKSNYTKNYDLNLISIRFTDTNEYEDTLRAFGLNVYNNNVYYIDFESESGNNLNYDEYIKEYDNINQSKLNTSNHINVSSTAPEAMLEIYIQIYNYLYGGYRTTLPTSLSNLPEIKELNDLRKVTRNILEQYIKDDSKYQQTLDLLNQQDLTYSKDDIIELTNNSVNYIYETLGTDVDNCFSTTSQSYNSSKYIFYKLSEGNTPEGEHDYREDGYSKDSTNDWIINNIIKTDEKLKENLKNELTIDALTETDITSYLTEECDKVGVKVYVEACEINYAISNTDYNKTKSKSDNDNILAVLSYGGKDWNLNIKANADDKKSILIPGTNEAFGVFDYLESQVGATTAINLITNKIIKTTKAYKEANKERDTFVDNINAMLSNFKAGYYAASGYPASIGKYDFLMAYFHSSDIDFIIDDYFRIQYASAQLLTDYSSNELTKFFKNFTDSLYDKYFSLSGSRLIVYFDGDDDNKADEIYFDENNELAASTKEHENWVFREVEFEGNKTTLGEVAKHLIYDVYKELASSTEDHSTVVANLITEINSSARVIYNNNPIVAENIWAKYRKLGLRVTSEEFTVSNSSIDYSFLLKQRLYDYSRGKSLDKDGNIIATYNYFINDSVPTCYIEPLTEEDIALNDETILATEDGFNLILVTEGSTSPSAKWTEEDNEDTILKDIKIKYNNKYTASTLIENVFNDDDKLNENQIKLYVLEYVTSNTSNLSATEISEALTTFISPVLTRYTGEETQRIILLNFINQKVNPDSPIYESIVYDNEGYNGENGYLNKIFEINRRIIDKYTHVYNDFTGTSDSYKYTDENGVEKDWWTALEESVDQFLINDNGGQE